MKLTRRSLAATAASSLAAVAFCAAGIGVLAQDSTPAPIATATSMTAAIHQGSCQAPVEQEIASLGSFGEPTDENGAPIQTQGIQTGPALLQAAADGVEFNLTDTLASGEAYVILVHQSPEQYSTYLACGELAGPLVNNNLAVGLRPLNNAGFAGVVTLSGDGGTLSSTAYLMSDLLALSGGTTAGTPETQPTPIAAQGTFPATEAPTPAPTETPAPPTETPLPPTATPTEAPVQITQVVEVTPTPTT
jgi:hypothetical protein